MNRIVTDREKQAWRVEGSMISVGFTAFEGGRIADLFSDIVEACPECGAPTRYDIRDWWHDNPAARRPIKIGAAALAFLMAFLMAISLMNVYDPRALGVAAGGSVQITREEYGDVWPFTVSDGTVIGTRGSAVVFRYGLTDYAVNGTASALGMAEIEPIWRDDPTGTSPKVSLGPIIDRGLKIAPLAGPQPVGRTATGGRADAEQS